MDFAESLKKLNERMDSFKCVTELQKTRRVLQEQAYAKVGALGEIFKMNMPTGSGKTLCSMKFALEKAVNEGKKHIIYVIPYNSIIDQTVDEMQKTFGESAEILRHQSSFSYEDDDGYEAYSEDYRDAAKAAVENWDAPLIVTTSVQFFESIFSHKKRKLRKLHNMADSIIIFDEAHLMPRKYLQPCLQAVAYITRYLNSSAVFLTATMPNFSDLLEKYALRDSRTVELIEDKSDFGKFHKCSFKYDGEISNEKLVSSAMENPSALIIVNRKATAKEIYELCSGEKYHLSTYMAACDRKKKIEDIRAALKRLEGDYPDGKDVPPERRIIIVSTSLIEAGVDIDVHSVYREMTGLDSVLQAGGRCNREGRRSDACTHIFSLEDEKAVVIGDGRENITKGLLEKYDDISDPACIEEYYDRLFFMNEDEITGNTISNDCMKLDSIPFKEYGKNFRIIDANTVSVVIDKDEDSHRMIEELKFAGTTDTRRLQKYTCSVKPKELEELMRQHVVEDYDSGIWCLTNMDYYSEETGIKFEGEDYFI